MTRAQRVVTISAISVTLYFLAFFAILPIPLLSQETTDKVLPVVCFTSRPQLFCMVIDRTIQLPWWLLISFGAYSLWTLGWNVMTIRDCPEAYHELMNVCSPEDRLCTFAYVLTFRH